MVYDVLVFRRLCANFTILTKASFRVWILVMIPHEAFDRKIPLALDYLGLSGCSIYRIRRERRDCISIQREKGIRGIFGTFLDIRDHFSIGFVKFSGRLFWAWFAAQSFSMRFCSNKEGFVRSYRKFQ